jgi:hypothetical protein
MSILAYNIGARWRCLGIIMSRMWHHGPTRFRSERPKDLLDKLESRKDAIEIGWMGPTGQTFDKAPHFNRNISAGNEMEETTLGASERRTANRCRTSNGFPARMVMPGWTGGGRAIMAATVLESIASKQNRAYQYYHAHPQSY